MAQVVTRRGDAVAVDLDHQQPERDLAQRRCGDCRNAVSPHEVVCRVKVSADRQPDAALAHDGENLRGVDVVVRAVDEAGCEQRRVLQAHDRAGPAGARRAHPFDVVRFAPRVVPRLFRIDERHQAHAGHVHPVGRPREVRVEALERQVVVVAGDDEPRHAATFQQLGELLEQCLRVRALAIVDDVAKDDGNVRLDETVDAVDGTVQQQVGDLTAP